MIFSGVIFLMNEVFVNDLNEQMYEVSGLECMDFVLIKLEPLEEKEHVSSSRTKNVSQICQIDCEGMH